MATMMPQTEQNLYVELLPAQCPPQEAGTSGYETIYRLLPEKVANANHFKSYAALEKAIPKKMDPCKWASCSLIFDPMKQVEKWPRLRAENPYAARLAIPQESGKSSIGKDRNHVDFWSFSHFDILTSVVEVIDLSAVTDND